MQHHTGKAHMQFATPVTSGAATALTFWTTVGAELASREPHTSGDGAAKRPSAPYSNLVTTLVAWPAGARAGHLAGDLHYIGTVTQAGLLIAPLAVSGIYVNGSCISAGGAVTHMGYFKHPRVSSPLIVGVSEAIGGVVAETAAERRQQRVPVMVAAAVPVAVSKADSNIIINSSRISAGGAVTHTGYFKHPRVSSPLFVDVTNAIGAVHGPMHSHPRALVGVVANVPVAPSSCGSFKFQQMIRGASRQFGTGVHACS